MLTITAWGRSMYGGYYANYYDEFFGHNGVRFALLRELREWARENGVKLETWRRFDND